jgi:hypothetical protein
MEEQNQNVSESVWTNVSRIALLVTAISLLTFAIGCFIINTHLSTYGLQDFDMVKPRAVYVGFMFCLLLFGNVALYFVLTEIKREKKAIKEVNTLKVGYFTALGFYIIESDWVGSNASNIVWKGVELTRIAWYYAIIVLFIWLLIASKPRRNIWRQIVKALVTSGWAFLFMVYGNNTTYLLLLLFQVVIAFFVYLYQCSVATKYLKEERTGRYYGPIRDELSKALDKIRLVQYVEAKYTIIVNSAMAIFGVGLLMLLVYLYSLSFYELISPSLGGGKLESIKYICGNDTVIGKKLYETSDKVYLLESKKLVRKLTWAEINKISLN